MMRRFGAIGISLVLAVVTFVGSQTWGENMDPFISGSVAQDIFSWSSQDSDDPALFGS